MNEAIRRAIAYQAASKIRGRGGNSIYSFEAGRYTFMSRNYDYDEAAFISPQANGFYHYGSSAQVQLTVRGKQFNGYDYGSGAHFQGTVNGNSVQVYDYGEGRFFIYSV